MTDHPLVQLMSNLTKLSSEEKHSIEQSYELRQVAKNTFLLQEGQIAKEGYFIISGCVREFKLLNGDDITTAFYTQNESLSDFQSIANQTPSKINFVCSENCELAVLTAAKEKALYESHPRFEAFCRDGVEEMMGEKQQQIRELMTLTPEERYLKLVQERPEVIRSVAQYHIASYLGIKPETLSRIRKKLAQASSF